MLQSLRKEKGTLVFYIPARKLPLFLNLINEAMGARQVVIAREITKIHEEFLRGTAEELMEMIEEKKLKGEATVLVDGLRKKSSKISQL